jgi:TRAP-type C4-dicarboxylate transport system permease small subunit
MVFTLALMYNGIGLSTTYTTCRSSIIICFVWYGLNRAGWIFFFIERAHNVRSSEVERRKDFIWIIGILYTCVLCLVLFILAMVYSFATFTNASNGDTCQLGIPRQWLIALMAIGTINLAWILVLYLWLLKPAIRHRVIVQEDHENVSVESSQRQFVGIKSGTNLDSEEFALPTMITHEKPAILRLENLIKKSIYGLLMMMPVEIFNFAYFLAMDGMEMGWVCFLICTLDGM